MAATKGFFFFFSSIKAYVKKNLILNISEFSVQNYANKLIKRKTAANIFEVLVFEVLGLRS